MSFSAALGLLALAGFALALADTGYIAFDEAAIHVKAPDRVLMNDIARAGNRLVAVGEHGVIAYSDDNGQSWRQAAVPVDVTLTAVAFTSPRQGWAVGNSGVILHTQDAGESWRLQLDGIQVNQLTLTAANAAVAAGSTALAAPLAVRRAYRLIAQGPSKPFLCILAQDAGHAMVFGSYRISVATTDGGQSWQDVSLRIGDPVSHHLYGVAVVGGDIFVVGEAGLVFRSTDGGNSFPQVTPAGAATLFGVTGTGDGGLLVYGVAGTMFRSTDLGQDWTQIALPDAANVMDVLPLKDGRLLAAEESGRLDVSGDHGQSFVPLPLSLPMAAFALAQAANGEIVVVGSGGIMTLPAPPAAPDQRE